MNKLIIFLFGSAFGYGLAWVTLRKKYEELTREEINSVIETFERLSSEKASKGEPDIKKSDIDILNDITEKQNYISKNDEKEENSLDKPYVIAPDEFGEFEDYEQVSLTLYSDGVLTDDCDEPVIDIEETVGLKSLESFGEYEYDSVYVRNDRLHCDFEILADERKFSEVKA